MKKLNRKLFATLLIFTSVMFSACRVQVESTGSPNPQERVTKNYFNYTNQNFNVSSVSSETKDGRKLYTWNYKKIDQKGNQIECSAFLEYRAPSSSTKQEIDLIFVDCHGTIFSDEEAPSNCKYASFVSTDITSKNVLIIAPDYIGY